ncbi:MAG: UDP-N-acetylmuramate--L-alanine ligase [Candidatus Glassbacteria bacterium]|nr:UDP-N-acetylmuramate--L-alanine ligase [Candidatus Glassbacteria bacterium]
MYRKLKKIHLVGIGGSGMCGIAEILLDSGYQVTGSDLAATATTDRLRELGASVMIGHDPGRVAGADVVVVSSAVSDDNPEVAAARAQHIPVIRRAEMLAELIRMKYGIAVAGTHGKTTTTSMIGLVLEHCGCDPTVIVGGRLRALGRHAKSGLGDLMVVEADEFDRSFLRLSPSIAVITNIESEHLDCYGDLEQIKDAFVEFANKVPFYGTVVACLDESAVVSIIPRIERLLFTYGRSAQADLQLERTSHDSGSTSSLLSLRGRPLGELLLQVPGEHNIKNALAAVAVGLELQLDYKKIAEALSRFTGVHRRTEIKGEAAGRMIVDDYAHHPTEIIATLDGLQKGWNRRIVAVFQPHLYSRTRDFHQEFGRSFMQSDILVVTEIYGAREKPVPGVSGELVAEAARKFGHRRVIYHTDLETLPGLLCEISEPGDLVVTFGAGNIYQVADRLLEKLEEI